MDDRINSTVLVKLIFVFITIFLYACVEASQEPTPLPTETVAVNQIEPTEVINPTKNAAYKPTNGSTPAINANATASGTNASATVKPDKVSVLKFLKSGKSIYIPGRLIFKRRTYIEVPEIARNC